VSRGEPPDTTMGVFPRGDQNMGCADPAPGGKGWEGGHSREQRGPTPWGGLAGFKPGFFPWGGDRRWVARGRGQRGPGRDGSTYWLVMEAWVAGWGKLVVQTV